MRCSRRTIRKTCRMTYHRRHNVNCCRHISTCWCPASCRNLWYRSACPIASFGLQCVRANCLCWYTRPHNESWTLTSPRPRTRTHTTLCFPRLTYTRSLCHSPRRCECCTYLATSTCLSSRSSRTCLAGTTRFRSRDTREICPLWWPTQTDPRCPHTTCRTTWCLRTLLSLPRSLSHSYGCCHSSAQRTCRNLQCTETTEGHI